MLCAADASLTLSPLKYLSKLQKSLCLYHWRDIYCSIIDVALIEIFEQAATAELKEFEYFNIYEHNKLQAFAHVQHW